jgi:hypothetical protein
LEHHRYGVSLYFAFTTVTTTGYGDIQPFNDLERLMSTLLMLARTHAASHQTRLPRRPCGSAARSAGLG